MIVLTLRRHNTALRAEIVVLRDSLAAAAIPVGEILPELTTFGPADAPAPEPGEPAPSDALAFEDGRLATVLYIHSAACGACEEFMPEFAALAATHRAKGVEFIAVQTDAAAPADLKRADVPFALRGVPGAERSWMRRIPLIPAVLIVDHRGILRAAWYGAMNDRQRQQLAAAAGSAARGEPISVAPPGE